MISLLTRETCTSPYLYLSYFYSWLDLCLLDIWIVSSSCLPFQPNIYPIHFSSDVAHNDPMVAPSVSWVVMRLLSAHKVSYRLCRRTILWVSSWFLEEQWTPGGSISDLVIVNAGFAPLIWLVYDDRLNIRATMLKLLGQEPEMGLPFNHIC